MTRPTLRQWATSYRTRLAVGFVAVTAILAGMWAWSLYGPLTSQVTDQQRGHLRNSARMAASALASSDRPLADEVRSLVAGSNLRMTVVARDGRVLADSQEDASRMGDHGSRPEIKAALAGRVGDDTRVSPTQGTPQMYVAVPGTAGGERVAVRVSEPLAHVAAIVAAARDTGTVALLLALVLALAVTWRLANRTARPVTRLASAARSMAAGDLWTRVEPERGELGEVAEALGALRDQIRAKMSDLEEGSALLRTVLDGLPDAVLLLDGTTIEYANGSVKRMTGPTPGDGAGLDLLASQLPAPIAAAIASGCAARTAATADLGPDPLMRYHRVTTIPLQRAESSARTLAVITDVTERRRLDVIRRDFVSNASHELKTPVAAIQLLADSAVAAADDGDGEKVLEFTGRLRDEAERLRRLVADLLDLSRLESPPSPDAVTNMREAADLALAGHRAAASAAGLALTLDTSDVEGEDVYASADPTDVAIELDNVLANAIAYTSKGFVRVRLSADDTSAVVAVSDTGPGISREHLPRVFERFYRVDSARTRDAGGTGLGLALVRNAAARSGGSVEIESTVGAGTAVTMSFPRATGTPRAANADALPLA